MEQGFSQIPNRLARDSSLDPYAKTVLLVLISYADERGECWPSLDTIAKGAGCSVASVKRALTRLRRRDLLTWKNRTRSKEGRTSNLYRLTLSQGKAHTELNPSSHRAEPQLTQSYEQEPVNNNQLTRERRAREMATSKGEYLPEDWEPSDKAKQWTTENYPHVNAGLELEKFVDYWQAASGQNARKRDWDATWRNWIRRAEKEYTRPAYKSQAQMLQEMKQTAHARAQGSALRLIAGGE